MQVGSWMQWMIIIIIIRGGGRVVLGDREFAMKD